MRTPQLRRGDARAADHDCIVLLQFLERVGIGWRDESGGEIGIRIVVQLIDDAAEARIKGEVSGADDRNPDLALCMAEYLSARSDVLRVLRRIVRLPLERGVAGGDQPIAPGASPLTRR